MFESPRFRVYKFIGRHRYYWCDGRWTIARWQADLLTLDEAKTIAEKHNAEYEKHNSNTQLRRKRPW